MPLEEIGAILLFLVVVFILGNLWFHFIEAILKRIKSLFHRIGGFLTGLLRPFPNFIYIKHFLCPPHQWEVYAIPEVPCVV